MQNNELSVIIPAKNEQASIAQVVSSVLELVPGVEVVVVDDGSSDSTAQLAEQHGAVVVSHPYSKGNGAAVKTGARAASGKYLLFMDGDGQHLASDIPLLTAKLAEGYDMVVGSRSASGQANTSRRWANWVYNKISSWMTGHVIEDLTSGMRLVVAEKFKEFLYLLPNGFSYPTTSTMAFFRAGYSVAYQPINVEKREGISHIGIFKDGLRFLLIIFKVGTLYSPLKLFFPIAVAFFGSGAAYYIYTYMDDGRFTNMAALLFIASILTFMMGLMSEQLTAILYKNK